MMILPNAADLFASAAAPTENSPEPKLTDSTTQDFAALLAASYAMATPVPNNLASTPEPVKVDDRSDIAITDATAARSAENIASAMPPGTSFFGNFSSIQTDVEMTAEGISPASSTNLEPVFGKDEQRFAASTAIPLKENNVAMLLAKTAATLAHTGGEQVNLETASATESQPAQTTQNQPAPAISLLTSETAQPSSNSQSKAQTAHQIDAREITPPLTPKSMATPATTVDNTSQPIRPSQTDPATNDPAMADFPELAAPSDTKLAMPDALVEADAPMLTAQFSAPTAITDAPPVLPLNDKARVTDANLTRPPVSSEVLSAREDAAISQENLDAGVPITIPPAVAVASFSKAISSTAQTVITSAQAVSEASRAVKNIAQPSAAPQAQPAVITDDVLGNDDDDPAPLPLPSATNAVLTTLAARPAPALNQIYFEIVDATKQFQVEDMSAFRKIQAEVKNVIASLQVPAQPSPPAPSPSSIVAEPQPVAALPSQAEINATATSVSVATIESAVPIASESILSSRAVSDEISAPILNGPSQQPAVMALEAAPQSTKETNQLQLEPILATPAPPTSFGTPPNAIPSTAAPLSTNEISPIPIEQFSLRQNDQPETNGAAQVFPALTSPQPNEARLPAQDIPATPPPAVIRQTAEAITSSSANLQPQEIQTLRLQLRPEQLGEVAIELARDKAGKIHISLVASSADAQQALTQDAGQLQQTLEQNGVNIARLEIFNSSLAQLSSQSQQQPHQQSQPQAENRFRQDNDLAASLTPINTDHSEADKLVSLHA